MTTWADGMVGGKLRPQIVDVAPRRLCQRGDGVTGFAERGSFMVASELLFGVEHETHDRGLRRIRYRIVTVPLSLLWYVVPSRAPRVGNGCGIVNVVQSGPAAMGKGV